LFRTYFINSRGDEAMGTIWSYLDMTALGRQEKWEDSPEGYPQTEPYKWWNWHDEYGKAQSVGERRRSRSRSTAHRPAGLRRQVIALRRARDLAADNVRLD
jgi:uncharacterized protein DUF899